MNDQILASVYIITLNEEKNIPLILKELKKISTKNEIIFVDDNSSDNSGLIIKRFLTNKIRFIKTIHGVGYKFIASPK